MNSFSFRNMESRVWTIESGPNIAPVPADLYIPTVNPDGSLRVTNYSSKAGGAALVTCKPIIPTIPGITWTNAGLDMELFISSIDMQNMGRFELDSKLCLQVAPDANTPIRNVVNGSSQLNYSKGGAFQIDGDPPGWFTPVPTFTPVIPTDTWFPVSFRYSYGAPGSTFSFLSASYAGQLYNVPAIDQNVPQQSTNWQALVFAVQLQFGVLNPGVLVVNARKITATVADNLIP